MSSAVSIPRRAGTLRGGYHLLLGTALAAGLGLVYWILAARLYPPEVVGTGAALFSAVTLVSGVSTIGLTGILNRYVPIAGADLRRFLAGAYASAGLVSTAIAILVGAVLAHYADGLAVLGTSWAWFTGFVGTAIAWTLISLESSALAGMRRARWVPVESLSVAGGRLIALAALAGFGSLGALLASWSLPGVFTLGFLSLLVFTRFAPAHSRRYPSSTLPRLRTLARRTAAYAIGAAVGYATLAVPPILALHALGAEAAAAFAIPWAITTALLVAVASFGATLTIEGSFAPDRLRNLAADALFHSYRVVMLPVALAVAFAPAVLTMFGTFYADSGAISLRILALATIPGVIINVVTGIARASDSSVTIVVLPVTQCLLTLVPMYPALHAWGLAGASLVWFIASAATAGLAVVCLRRMRRLEDNRTT